MKLHSLDIMCSNYDLYTIGGEDIIEFDPCREKTVIKLNNKNYKVFPCNGHDDRTPTFLERMSDWSDIEMICVYYPNGKHLPYCFDNLFQRAEVDPDGESLCVEIFH